MNLKIFFVSIVSSAVTGYGVYRTMTAYNGETLTVDVVVAIALAAFYAWIYS